MTTTSHQRTDIRPRKAANALSGADTLRLFRRVVFPVWAQGILLKRPRMLAWAERGAWDARAVAFLQGLRRRYGEGPLIIRMPWRSYALILAFADARRILDGTPTPFTAASTEKRAALSHFEPHNSLITRGSLRSERRQLHDAVLESDQKCHHLAERFLSQARDEIARLLETLGNRDLTWPIFSSFWYAAARRVVFGDQARDDASLTDMLYRLRSHSNWVVFRALDKDLRARYREALQLHLKCASAGSLAGLARSCSQGPELDIADQVTQWLFAFDGGGMTVFRALALAIALRPDLPDADHVRALFLDTLRLWPTTPAILRESTIATSWQNRDIPAGTGFIIFTPFFHRDDERLAQANRLDCAAWLNKDPAGLPPFLPFSSGPAVCPGRQLVTLMATEWLSALRKQPLTLVAPEMLREDRLPGTLDFFAIRLRRAIRE